MSSPRVRYQLAVSIDGLIGPPDGNSDWLDPYGPVAITALEEFMPQIGGLVMGRVTYEQMRSFGPGPFDDTPTVVLTSRADLAVGPMARVCTEGPRASIEMIRDRLDGKDIWLFGGGVTASGFLAENLVDTIEITTVPVVLGTGMPLFPDVRGAVTFELVSSQVGESGTITTVYARG